MNGQGTDRLYKLLPELYRWRDESHSQSLRVFLALIEQELHVLETDTAAMYENWFIQTCEDWVVPYIAELLGIRNAAHGDQLPFTQRRRVANTLAYRRRSGTVSVLEQVMWDVTNWHVSACEFGQCLAITSHLRHRAPVTAGSVRVRDTLAAAQINDPLSRLGHTADIRRPNVRALPTQAASAVGEECEPPSATDLTRVNRVAGRYTANTIGLFFWRLRSYPITRGRPYNVRYDSDSGVALYTFRPDGRDAPLFHRPQSFKAITQLAQRANLPMPITRLELDADLQAVPKSRQQQASPPATSIYYGPGRSLNIICNASDSGRAGEYAIDAEKVVCAALRQGSARSASDWPEPSAIVALAVSLNPTARAVVDPEQGRLAVLLKASDEAKAGGAVDFARPDQVLVDYAYAFSTEIGGGQYARQPNLENVEGSDGDICTIDVVAGSKASKFTSDKYGGRLIADTLPCALRLWSSYCREMLDGGDGVPVTPKGLIRILDSSTYSVQDAGHNGSTNGAHAGESAAIWLPANGKLAVVAINGAQPTLLARGSNNKDGKNSERSLRVVFDDPRSSRAAALSLAPAALLSPLDAPEAEQPMVTDRWLYLSGLHLIGALELVDSELQSISLLDIRVDDCTLDGGVRARMQSNARSLSIELARSISGPLLVPRTAAGVRVYDSIVDTNLDEGSPGRYAIAGVAAPTADPTGPPLTIVRSTVFGEVAVCRLDEAEAVIFTQQLCVDDPGQGYVRYSYMPAGSQAPHRCERNLHGGSLAAGPGHLCCCDKIAEPNYTARRYGRPGYGQLSTRSAPEFRHWIGDGGELGAFHNLYQAQREVNIRQIAAEYLPAGFELDVFYVT